VTNLSYDVYGEDCYVIEAIKQNKRLYTKRQVEAARRVRISASVIVAMALADIIGQVMSRRVDGINFTVEAVVRAYEIYGSDLQAVRGKTVKKKYPSPSQREDRRFESVLPSRLACPFACSCASGSREEGP
jgi:hypothetical protein